jgi:iduronate 2-sulfatase
MFHRFTFILCIIASVTYGESKPNILLLCIDDLRPELKSFGVDYIHSPNIDELAARGRPFFNHYVQAPTCGASRYTLLTGTYGSYGNGALFVRSKNIKHPSLPAYFRENGYTTVSVGKVSHHPGGRGGKDWDDDAQPEMPESWDRHLLPAGPWMHPRGAMHGLANGEIRNNAKDMDLYQAFDGADEAYPDGLITNEALNQLEQLAKGESPFFLAVGIIRPHLPFGAPLKYMEPYKNVNLPKTPHPNRPEGKTTFHGSGEFMKYNRWGRNPNTDAEFAELVRKHYAGCVTYADAMVGKVLKKLDDLGKTENTIVALWGDHGWHLGEHSVWGKHTLFEESLRSPLIIAHKSIPSKGEGTQAIVETIDIYPTLCDLAGLQRPGFLHGQSLKPQLISTSAAGHLAVSYAGSAQTIRNETHRLILHKNGETELYEQSSLDYPTENLSEKNQELVADLKKQLEARLSMSGK